jgi:hypothetical protein
MILQPMRKQKKRQTAGIKYCWLLKMDEREVELNEWTVALIYSHVMIAARAKFAQDDNSDN